jgi:ribosomal protein L3 glutamine methyltransferase
MVVHYSILPGSLHYPAAPECPLPMTAPKTIRQSILEGASRLQAAGVVFGHGTDNALDEAATLVLHALGLPFNLPGDQLDRGLSEAQRRHIDELIGQRIRTRKPAAYLTGETLFAGLPFYVDERVLVPRSPIAELIGDGFRPWLDPGQVRHVLDLCTGSGCIGIACAFAFPEAHVDLADLSADALAVAERNLRRHALQGRVRTIHSDLFEALGGQAYDLIVCNPPYVPDEDVRQLPEEYRHEPPLGLVAGEDGLDIVLRILARAPSHLSASGILVTEVGYSQPALEAAFPAVPFLWLDFEFGGEGVFLLEREQLVTYHAAFAKAARQRQRASVNSEVRQHE